MNVINFNSKKIRTVRDRMETLHGITRHRCEAMFEAGLKLGIILNAEDLLEILISAEISYQNEIDKIRNLDEGN